MTESVHIIHCEPFRDGNELIETSRKFREAYPNYNFYNWSNSVTHDMVASIPFVKACYDKGFYKIVNMYLTSTVIYELGGIAFGNDVMLTETLPQELFDSAFISNNTVPYEAYVDLTCCCYAEKGNPIFEALTKYFTEQNPSVLDDPSFFQNFYRGINRILTKFGCDTRVPSTETQTTDVVKFISSRQLGFYDYMSDEIMKGIDKVYCVKAHKTSLRSSYNNKMSLYYMILGDNTTKEKVIEGIDDFLKIDMTNKTCPICLLLLVNSSEPWVNECVDYMNLSTPISSMKKTKVLAVGDGVPYLTVCRMLPDVIGPVFHSLEICRNLLFGSGKLTNPINSPWAVK